MTAPPSQEKVCTLLVGFEKQTPTQKELKERLEKGDTATRIQALADMISLTLNGESQQKLIMTVIKHIQPLGTTTTSSEKKDNHIHSLKKLVLYFWEVIEKTDASGKLLPELIMLVDFLRRDLEHPNEYVRGATLRFMCRLRERDILEPLAPTVRNCLKHRHCYVRRNAILAISHLYQTLPDCRPDDAEDIIEDFLKTEQDVTAKRNAFLMLYSMAPDRAVEYLRSIMDTDWAQSTSDVFQLALVELLKQLMQSNPNVKSMYVKVIFALLQSKSQAVLFQCASTLLALSSSPTAIKASASTFVSLLNTHSDNNVKLVVVGKLEKIKSQFPEILQELAMDLLRCIVGAEMEIQKRVLNLTLELVSSKNVEKVVQFLRKVLLESSSATQKAETAFRQMVIKFMHQSTIKYKFVAPLLIPVLMDFITEDTRAAQDTIVFIREMVHRQPELRQDVVTQITLSFSTITDTRVFRHALWILGTYSETFEEARNVTSALKAALQPFPLWLEEKEEEEAPAAPTAGGGATVREDGTYVMSAPVTKEEEPKQETTSFRSLITGGDFFLAGTLASTLVKLVSTTFRMKISEHSKEAVRKDALEVLGEVLRLGKHKSLDTDSHERLRLCQAMLKHPTHALVQQYPKMAYRALTDLLAEEDRTKQEVKEKDEEKKFVPWDQVIQFTQLLQSKRMRGGGVVGDLEDVTTAAKNEALKGGDYAQRLGTVVQLTGFDDPVYVEATCVVHQFDILLSLLVVNQTSDTLQNLTVELGTVGDLKLCERPQTYTVDPLGEVRIEASIKVSSTEAGIVFGNVVYDSVKPGQDQTVIVLNNIHMDIIDYVHPASCTTSEFRSMWLDFEWENKITVNTDIKSLREYLDHILKHTNMKCQATSTSLAGDSDFLSANLYAKSSFGEPVVANISVHKQPTGSIEGYVRIRSQTQGIALGLGDKVTMKQKG
eukprot:Sspe_Gene.6134::Locus_2057_Transcript_1_1_Confidence_1.000_Length_2963::g.6134::m.6134/K17301/COPB1, SEC26; coatomer subunit beta